MPIYKNKNVNAQNICQLSACIKGRQKTCALFKISAIFFNNLKAVDGLNKLLSRILLRSQESQDNLRAVDGLNQLLSGNSEEKGGGQQGQKSRTEETKPS